MSSARLGESGPPRCLITGGAGFLGINLVRYLRPRGFALRSLDIAPFDYPEAGVVEVVHGDIREPATVDRAMAGVDLVVHGAAALPLCPDDAIVSTEVTGTEILLASARRHGVARLVHISSTAVYGIPDHHPLREDDPLHGVGAYGQAKIEAEARCREARTPALCLPILRPKTFVGPERLGVFELLYDWAADGHNFPLLGRGDNRYQLLDVEDLCQAIHLCLTGERAAVDDTFNVGAKRFGSMRADFQAVLDRAGRGKRVVALPAAPVIAVLKLLEALGLSPLYQWIYETAAKDSWVSIERIEQRLGFAPRFSNQDALVRNYEWYMINRERIRGVSGVSHRRPWKQGALRLAKQLF